MKERSLSFKAVKWSSRGAEGKKEEKSRQKADERQRYRERDRKGGRKNSPVQTVGSKVDPYEVQKQNKRRADKCLLPLLITTAQQHTNDTTSNDDDNKDKRLDRKSCLKILCI